MGMKTIIHIRRSLRSHKSGSIGEKGFWMRGKKLKAEEGSFVM
jgi:hypothetical protein